MSDNTQKILDRIEETIRNLRSALSEQLSQLEESLKASSGDVHAKVEERQSRARRLELDKKLTELWDEMKYYPGWANPEEWKVRRLIEIDEPRAEKREKEHDVGFLLNGHGYTFTYRDEGSTRDFDGDDFHHAQLSVRDESQTLLIEINISVEYEYGSVLKPFNVFAFIPGP